MQDLLTRLLLAGGGGFSPSALFGGGAVQGAWYDPSDFGTTGTGGVGTLFQDAAGTTPVTAVEQPVGLMLDKSKGLVLGANLVTNGGPFVNTTGWTAGNSATLSVSSGKLSVAAAVGVDNGQARTSFATVSGVTYRLVLYIEAVANSRSFVRVGTGAGLSNLASLAQQNRTGTFTLFFVATTTTTHLALESFDGGATVLFDNISVRELPGNHAFQSTSASRPTLRARYNLLTRTEEFNDAAWTRVNANITANAGVAPDGTTTADSLVATTTGPQLYQTFTIADSTIVTASVYLKKVSGSDWAYIRIREKAGANYFFWANLVTGAAGSTSGSPTAFSVSSVGNGWYRLTLSGSSNTGATTPFVYVSSADANGSGNALNGDSILVWGAQLTATAVFPSNTYQRVGAATDYATGAAFPPYLFFDGTDDSMLTNSVDFATVTSDGQARRNLLTNPTQFDAAGWTRPNTTVTANATTAPDGTSTADKLVSSATTTQQRTSFDQQTLFTANTYTLTVYAKAAEWNFCGVTLYDGTYYGAVFSLVDGSTSFVQAGTTASATSVGSGWWRLRITATTTNTLDQAAQASGFWPRPAIPTVNIQQSITGDGTSGIFLWGAQLETGSTATAFQNIGTDQMTVFAGITKSSDAATGMLVELSALASSNNGAFALFNASGAASYNSILQGTATYSSGYTTFTAPITNVASLAYNIAGATGADEVSAKFNGVTTAPSSTSGSSAGTGNFGNYPLYIGRRNNATLPFNGNLYSLIIQGATPTSSQLVSTEQWVAAKTPLGSV